MDQIFSDFDFNLFKSESFNFRNSSVEYRIEILESLKAEIIKSQTEICDSLMADFNKPMFESQLTEILPVISELSHTLDNIKNWTKPVSVASPFSLITTSCYVQYRPRGTTLIIAPWNYPFQLAISPLIAAIASGNSVVLKPSEFAPSTGLIIKKIITSVFPKKIVTVEIGDHEISEKLTSLPFDHIFFTGSTQVGRKIMASAANNLTAVTLELGGKSPVIIDESADITAAAEKIFWGKYLNAGQTCVAPDYIFIHHLVEKEFCEKFSQVHKSIFSKVILGSEKYCGLIHHKHFSRIQRLLNTALEAGNELIVGGQFSEEKCSFEVSLIKMKNFKCDIMEEEIFGPLVPYLTYESLDECINFINARPHPLALYIFSEEKSAIKKVLNQTLAGGSCVNEVILHLANPDLPFGGVGQSGLGNYHGFAGFRAFSHEQSVLKQNGPSWLSKLFYPPYSGWKKKFIKFLIRYS